MMEEKTVGILLAGGMSRRFGRPKAFEAWDGQPFYELAYDALKAVCDEVVIVTRPEFLERFPDKYCTVVDEPEYKDCGPMAGIYTGMKHIKGSQYVVLPCDMPLIQPAIISELFRKHRFSVTVVDTENELQPLVSIWNKECESILKLVLDEGNFAMTSALEKLRVHTVPSTELSDEPERFMNINTVRHFKEMTRWLKS